MESKFVNNVYVCECVDLVYASVIEFRQKKKKKKTYQ